MSDHFLAEQDDYLKIFDKLHNKPYKKTEHSFQEAKCTKISKKLKTKVMNCWMNFNDNKLSGGISRHG
jgi:hypothetical protein